MGIKEKIKEIKESDNFWAGLLRDFIFTLMVFTIFTSISYIAMGSFSPMVAVESGSMIPHIQIGDIIFVESANRTEIITNEAGKKMDYSSFNEYGNVILYKPHGKEGATPIIHRAMYLWTMEILCGREDLLPHMQEYITKGDNNDTNTFYDQQGSISYRQPIKKEWVIGVARFRPIPLLGCVPLAVKGNLACFNT